MVRRKGEVMRKPIGVYGLTNTCGLAVYEFDHVEDRVLVGVNDQEPEWYDMTFEENEVGTILEGFKYGELFVPFDEVMRV